MNCNAIQERYPSIGYLCKSIQNIKMNFETLLTSVVSSCHNTHFVQVWRESNYSIKNLITYVFRKLSEKKRNRIFYTPNLFMYRDQIKILVGSYGHFFQTKPFGGRSGIGRIFCVLKGMHPQEQWHLYHRT